MAGLKLLLVEDEEDFVAVLSKRLRRRGFDVQCASSSEEALESLQSRPVDVVVLDVRLPGKDGLYALGQIKDLYPGTPVIMLSGFTDRNKVAVALERGAFTYLMKPASFEDLLTEIELATEQKKS